MELSQVNGTDFTASAAHVMSAKLSHVSTSGE